MGRPCWRCRTLAMANFLTNVTEETLAAYMIWRGFTRSPYGVSQNQGGRITRAGYGSSKGRTSQVHAKRFIETQGKHSSSGAWQYEMAWRTRGAYLGSSSSITSKNPTPSSSSSHPSSSSTQIPPPPPYPVINISKEEQGERISRNTRETFLQWRTET